jgi:integrase
VPGSTFAQRRDAAVLSVFRATGIRLAELAAIRYDPGDPRRSDLDLGRREIHVRGKGGRDRTVKVDHEAARRLDRYLRVRARHEQAHRLGLWLGTGGRGPVLVENSGADLGFHAAYRYSLISPPSLARRWIRVAGPGRAITSWSSSGARRLMPLPWWLRPVL